VEDISCHPHHIQVLSDKLHEISDAFQHARFGAVKKAATDQQRHLLMLQERIRIHTQGVRNWGYYEQVKAILRKLFATLDPHCHRIAGIKATEFIEVFSRMLKEIEQGMNDHTTKLAPVFAKRTPKEFVAEY